MRVDKEKQDIATIDMRCQVCRGKCTPKISPATLIPYWACTNCGHTSMSPVALAVHNSTVHQDIHNWSSIVSYGRYGSYESACKYTLREC